MSGNEFDLAGKDLKEWSLIILILAIAFIFVVVGAVIIIIVLSGDFDLELTGSLDVGDYNVIIVGIAMVAVTLIAQQLTAKQTANTIRENDASWHKSEEIESGKGKPKDPNDS